MPQNVIPYNFICIIFKKYHHLLATVSITDPLSPQLLAKCKHSCMTITMHCLASGRVKILFFKKREYIKKIFQFIAAVKKERG